MAKSPKNGNHHTHQEVVESARRDVMDEDLFAATKQDAGKGVSFKQEDQLVPLIYVLQNGSPACNKREPTYIQGAEPGHFWLRGAVQPIMDGEQGIEAIPCGIQRTWIEWQPDRKGFVARHNEPPKDMESRSIRNDAGVERTINVRKNGNSIQDTREFYILVEGHPYVLPCAGTKHSFARSWNSMFHQYLHPDTKEVMPAFARKYLLKTVPQKNAFGSWYGLQFADLGFVTMAEYKVAKALNDAIERGEKKAEAPVSEHAGPAGGDDDIPF